MREDKDPALQQKFVLCVVMSAAYSAGPMNHTPAPQKQMIHSMLKQIKTYNPLPQQITQFKDGQRT